MIQYVATDLDGTLLQNGAQKVPAHIFDIILRLKEKGILFVVASGRPYANIRRLFEPVKDDIAYVSENGSMCVFQNKVISRGIIERSLGLRIIRAGREYGNCHPLLSCEARCYTDSTDERFIDHMNNTLRYNMGVVPDLCEIQEPFLKLAMCDFSGTDKEIQFFRERFASEIPVVTAGRIWVDFIAPEANKGAALAKVLHYFGISLKNGIAFGDQYNDIEMLETAGVSYAMETAAPGVNKHASYVTSSVTDVLGTLL